MNSKLLILAAILISSCKKEVKTIINQNSDSNITTKERLGDDLNLRLPNKRVQFLKDTLISEKYDINFDGVKDIQVFIEIYHKDTIPYITQYLKILNPLISINYHFDNNIKYLTNQFVENDYITINQQVNYSYNDTGIYILNEFLLYNCNINGLEEICIVSGKGKFLHGKSFIAFTNKESMLSYDRKIGYFEILNDPTHFIILKIALENTLNKPIKVVKSQY